MLDACLYGVKTASHDNRRRRQAAVLFIATKATFTRASATFQNMFADELEAHS